MATLKKALKRTLKPLFKTLPGIGHLLEQRDKLLHQAEELSRQLHLARQQLPVAQAGYERFKTGFAPGHYYSAVPDLVELRKRESQIFGDPGDGIPGIDLRQARQEELLRELAVFYPELPFSEKPQQETRYYYDNPNFSYTDGIVLYGMIRRFQPRKIVEIGCGFSSCVVLDTNERFFNNSVECAFIDPFPQLLLSLLRPEDMDRITLLHAAVQEVPLSVFEKLQANDILFVDSSHVLKTGADLNHILFDVLPRLRAGVLVHFHDAPFPFEYPREWVFSGRAWNECYALRAFLQYNSAFEILYFNNYIVTKCRTFVETNMPLCLRNSGGSLWLRKITEPGPGDLRNIVQQPSVFVPKPFFDAVYLDHPHQLGRGWFECDKDLAGRWMGGSAEAILRGPETNAQQIRLKGHQPNPAGTVLSVFIDGILAGTARLQQGSFNAVLPVPSSAVGKERVIVRLDLDKTYQAPDDDRRLGLSFGTIEFV